MHACEPLNLILAPQSCILTLIKRVQLLIKIPVPTLSVTNYSLSTASKLPQHSLQVGIGLTHMGLNLRQVSRLQEPQPCAVLCILILLNRKEVQTPVPKPPSLSALHHFNTQPAHATETWRPAVSVDCTPPHIRLQHMILDSLRGAVAYLDATFAASHALASAVFSADLL